MHILYKLVFASGKAYIGQTARNMSIRIAQHKRSVKSGSQLPVHCAWRKYGDPEIMVVAEFETQDELHAAEKAAIIAVGTLAPQGYNVAYGGDTAPSKNPEVAAKIADKATGRKYSDVSSWVDASTRRWKDADYRKKVSDGLKAAWTDEKRSKRSEFIKNVWEKRKEAGYSMSEETKQKLSAYARTPESRAKMSQAAKARKRTLRNDETKQKISGKTASSWQDPEVRAKRLAAMQLAREKRKQEKALCP
jgi:hypothetical protein